MRKRRGLLAKINIKTNLSLLLVLLGVVILAFIEGVALNKAIIKAEIIQGSEIQLIAFIIISLFMLGVSTLKPEKLILVSYSSMTLGLIVITTAIFDPVNKAPLSIKTVQLGIGTILIVFGFLMSKGLKVNRKEQEIVSEGLKGYRKL